MGGEKGYVSAKAASWSLGREIDARSEDLIHRGASLNAARDAVADAEDRLAEAEANA